MSSFVFAETEVYKIGVESNLQFTCTLNGAIPSELATYTISIYYPNGSLFLEDGATTPQGSGSFNYSVTFDELGIFKVKNFCTDGTYSYSNEGNYEITPSGKKIDNDASISIGILYFYVILGLGLVFLGFLFLNNNSLWISYSGLIIMLLGFTFLYYDLHLSNLYATTIAINSGAGGTTTGAFVMIAKFLKLAPYIVAGIIMFFSVRTLRMAIGKRKGNDGWDEDKY